MSSIEDKCDRSTKINWSLKTGGIYNKEGKNRIEKHTEQLRELIYLAIMHVS